MPIQPFIPTNFASASGAVPNVDDDTVHPEDLATLPWPVNPHLTWLYYNCWIEIALDAGMALHKQLPQGPAPVDTLAEFAFDDPNIETAILDSGVDITSGRQEIDVIQRMATSDFRFILKGIAYRLAYQVPIPGIVRIGQIPAVPERVQRAYNKVVANYCGIPLWYAIWELHYMIALPQGVSTGLVAPVPPNVAQKIRPDAELPIAIRLPRTVTDQNSVRQSILVGG
jgi:hypothetical protein